MRLRRFGWKKALGLVVGSIALLVVVLLGVGYAVTKVPPPSKIATAQSTRILYADGSEIGRLGKNRTLVPLSKVSDPAQKAVLAAEDRQFYSEPGISVRGIARALFANVKGGGVSQGGSTITQQYAKNAFLTQERTFTRKIKEAFIAVKLSRTTSHDKILEDYLNTIYFGRGAYGIEAAAETYFHTTADKLTVAQSAVLASSVRSPAGYDPARHPQAAKDRWAYVLDGMAKQKWLDPAARAAAAYPPVDKLGSGSAATSFPAEKSFLREQVIADLGRHGIAEDRLTAGGLIVRTTVVRRAQEAAVAAVDAFVPPDSTKDAPVAALASIEPGSGKVVAYVGGRTPGGLDFADDAPRKGVQPGSSMKPYVLAAALDKGISLDTRYDGSNHQDICGQKDVSNDKGDPLFGQVDLSTGLEFSLNTVYLRLACDVGPKQVVEAARAAGIPDADKLDGEGNLSAQIALGSGGYEIHPLDQAVGYATFAARGERASPYFVSAVTQADGGASIYKAKPVLAKAFSEGVAADVTYAMQQVVAGGTGTRAALDGRPTAGKTGTTTNNTNAWFAGFTPQLSTAVWVGRPSGAPLRGVLGITGGVSGGRIPAKVFKRYMDSALAGAQVLTFPPRAGVGTLATPTPSPGPTVTATPTASPTASPTPSASALPSATGAPSPTLPPATSPPPSPAPSLPPPVTSPPAVQPPSPAVTP